MGYLKCIWISIFFLASLSLLAEKKALLIAIGDYPDDSGWHDISSTNDLKYIRPLLFQNGFNKEDVKELEDSRATYKNIVSSFINLVNSVGQGDIVYVQFSGHGQQVVDDNNDEIDKLDEAIVPYDSPRNYKSDGYKGELLIRDDMINQFFTSIRRIIGAKGQLIYVMDSCHSGTGSRGRGVSRGTDIIMGSPAFTQNNLNEFDSDSPEAIDTSTDVNKMAPFISFYGSSQHELNYEYIDQSGMPVGSLTYAFSKSLFQYGTDMLSGELFDRVKLKMLSISPAQKPQFEGTKDAILFGSSTKKRKEYYYDILKIEDGKIIEADLGYMHGSVIGATVEIIDLNQNKVATRGEIMDVGLVKSFIKLDKEIGLDREILYKVKYSNVDISSLMTTVNFEISNQVQWEGVVTGLRKSGYFTEESDEAELYLEECEQNESLQLITKEGDVLYEGKKGKSENYHLFKLLGKMKAYSQSKFLRDLNSISNDYKLEVALIKLENGLMSEFENNDTLAQVQEGDTITLRISNLGMKPAYYSVVDVQPDHRISVLVPGGKKEAIDFYINPGETQVLNYPITVHPPYGTDVLKIIATDKPINIENIISSEGHVRGGGEILHPIEALFKYSYQEENRSESSSTLEYNWNSGIGSLIFEVVPKR